MEECETQKFLEWKRRRNIGAEEKRKLPETGRSETLVSNRFVANDFVAFDYCGDAYA